MDFQFDYGKHRASDIQLDFICVACSYKAFCTNRGTNRGTNRDTNQGMIRRTNWYEMTRNRWNWYESNMAFFSLRTYPKYRFPLKRIAKTMRILSLQIRRKFQMHKNLQTYTKMCRKISFIEITLWQFKEKVCGRIVVFDQANNSQRISTQWKRKKNQQSHFM